ncbi:hypothetical protein G6F35_016504 [Rhizopus arrhizus]|nr:hypothetical protein G6F35_016504 [Rhizopus arrhizus]
MRVLNRSFAALPPASLLAYVAALAASLLLAVQVTGDLKLALWVLGGLAALAVAAGVVGFVLLQLLRGLQHRLHGNWRLGLAALTRRRMLAVMQLVGLSLSLCALLLLAVTGPGLLQQWRERLPADTPNYFLINIQPEQRDSHRTDGHRPPDRDQRQAAAARGPHAGTERAAGIRRSPARRR